MKTKILLSILIVTFFVGSCEKHEPAITRNIIEVSQDQKTMIAASNNFGLSLFNQVVQTAEPDKNILISPLSVSLALTMLYNGSSSITREELTKILDYSGMTDEQVNVACRDLIKTLVEADPNVIMKVANSIWYKNNFYVKPDFIATNKNYFDAAVLPGKFDVETKDSINQWVENKTNAKIKELLDFIPPDAVIYLINAVYFKGTWQYKFDPGLTSKSSFLPENGNPVPTDFMTQTGSFNYLQKEDFTAVDLPYGDSNFSMTVLLPNPGKNYKDILAQMSNENWADWKNSMTRTNVTVFLPKFRFEFGKLLNEDLKALGMQSSFDEADLSGISDDEGLFVSRVIHKTFVEVNEEGTEAAAATAVEISKNSFPGTPETFKADRPFIFVIRERDTNCLMFTGIVKNPPKEK